MSHSLYLRTRMGGDLSRAEYINPPPDTANVSTHLVAQGIAEGWIEGENEKVAHRPGGPPNDPWRVTHTFRQYSHLTIAGVRYEVVHQPDKYADYDAATFPDQVKSFKANDSTKVGEPAGDIYSAGATRVDWFYTIKKEPKGG